LRWERKGKAPELRARHLEVRLEPLLEEALTVLGQVASDEQEELVKKIKIGDLSMWTTYKTINDHYQVALTEELYCTPERGRTRAWLLAEMAGFRVYLSIVGKKTQHFKGDFPLPDSQAQHVLQAISDLIEAFTEETGGEDASG
jgi:hypothetical protein